MKFMYVNSCDIELFQIFLLCDIFRIDSFHCLQQWRLFPYLAAACVYRIFMSEFANVYLENVQKSMSGENIPNLVRSDILCPFYHSSNQCRCNNCWIYFQSLIVAEIHCIVSAIKPLFTWSCRDAIRECREACGGHGYHKSKFFPMSFLT